MVSNYGDFVIKIRHANGNQGRFSARAITARWVVHSMSGTGLSSSGGLRDRFLTLPRREAVVWKAYLPFAPEAVVIFSFTGEFVSFKTAARTFVKVFRKQVDYPWSADPTIPPPPPPAPPPFTAKHCYDKHTF